MHDKTFGGLSRSGTPDGALKVFWPLQPCCETVVACRRFETLRFVAEGVERHLRVLRIGQTSAVANGFEDVSRRDGPDGVNEGLDQIVLRVGALAFDEGSDLSEQVFDRVEVWRGA